MVELDHYSEAIAVAPVVSMDYWKQLVIAHGTIARPISCTVPPDSAHAHMRACAVGGCLLALHGGIGVWDGYHQLSCDQQGVHWRRSPISAVCRSL